LTSPPPFNSGLDRKPSFPFETSIPPFFSLFFFQKGEEASSIRRRRNVYFSPTSFSSGEEGTHPFPKWGGRFFLLCISSLRVVEPSHPPLEGISAPWSGPEGEHCALERGKCPFSPSFPGPPSLCEKNLFPSWEEEDLVCFPKKPLCARERSLPAFFVFPCQESPLPPFCGPRNRKTPLVFPSNLLKRELAPPPPSFLERGLPSLPNPLRSFPPVGGQAP